MAKQKIITNSSVSCEVKKMKQGMSYSSKEKTIIMNVFKYFRSQCPDKNVTEIVRHTSKATGCSEKSIFSFRKEEVSPQGFKEPSKIKIRKKVNINNRLVKYNASTRDLIKNVIYELKGKNINPSLSMILRSLNENDNIPRFSLMTLRRLLSDMGFYYEKNENKSVLVEKLSDKKSTNGVDGINKKKVIPLEPPLTESFTSNSTHIVNDKGNNQINSNVPLNPTPVEGMQKTTPLVKVDNNSQSFIQHHHPHQIYAPLAAANYESSRENNFMNMNVNSSPHISLMFAPRMPPYHLHSSVQSPHLYPNDLYLKEFSSEACRSSQLEVLKTTLP